MANKGVDKVRRAKLVEALEEAEMYLETSQACVNSIKAEIAAIDGKYQK